MLAMIIGVALILFTIFAALPGFLGWGAEIITFLKGAAPILSAFIGIIAIFVGIKNISLINSFTFNGIKFRFYTTL